jgi:hypothetical protein
MFQLLRFNIDSVTGNVDVIAEYDLASGKTHREVHNYINEEVATEWVINTMRTYLLKKLQRFVDHKKILSECSHLWSSEHEAEWKAKSLSIIQWNLNGMKDYPLDLVCMVIIRLLDHMQRVLPNPAQESYLSSKENIRDLVATCSEYISSYNHKSKAA